MVFLTRKIWCGTMTKADLLESWKGIPSNVEIFVESDHGQIPEFAYGIEYTDEDLREVHREDIIWKDIKPSTDLSKITAILIR
jgi:hypothetical protein